MFRLFLSSKDRWSSPASGSCRAGKKDSRGASAPVSHGSFEAPDSQWVLGWLAVRELNLPVGNQTLMSSPDQGLTQIFTETTNLALDLPIKIEISLFHFLSLSSRRSINILWLLGDAWLSD